MNTNGQRMRLMRLQIQGKSLQRLFCGGSLSREGRRLRSGIRPSGKERFTGALVSNYPLGVEFNPIPVARFSGKEVLAKQDPDS
jgi:hypothetical protein